MDLSRKAHGVYDRQLASKSAWRLYLLMGGLLVVLATTAYLVDRYLAVSGWEQREQQQVSVVSSNLAQRVGDAFTELQILASDTALLADDVAARTVLADAFTRIMRLKRNYLQLRLIDTTGMERVRVDAGADGPRVLPAAELQLKADRYYVHEGLGLESGQLYLSPLDLNVEAGEIEVPFRPVIRLVMPAFDSQGRRQGILVANLAAAGLLQTVALQDRNSPADVMLLNADGYWLYHPDSSLAWGWQLPHGTRFADRHAQVWPRVQSSKTGQLLNGQGLFSYQRVSYAPFANMPDSQLDDAVARSLIVGKPVWYLVSLVDNQQLYAAANRRGQVMLVVVLCGLLVSWPFSRSWGIRHARYTYAMERIRTYADIVEHSDELIYVVSPQGRILFANPAVVRCYGYELAELIGHSPSLFKSDHHPEAFYQLLWKTVAGGEVFEGVFVNRRKDGSQCYEAKRIAPILGDDGQVRYYVSLGQDLTSSSDTKLHEMQIASRVSAGVEHHFSNLLTAVGGYLQLAIDRLDNQDPAAGRALLDKSLEAAERSQQLVMQIASIGASRSGGFESVDVAKLVMDTIEHVRDTWLPSVGLSVSCDAAVPMVAGSQELLETALLALLDNARQAVDEAGHVRVTVRLVRPVREVCVNCQEPIKGDHLAIAVSDDGKGIDDAIRGEIFDPFFSTRESAMAVFKTPGLGLTVVRSIAHLHGGHLLLDSVAGAGTTVQILIPLVSEA